MMTREEFLFALMKRFGVAALYPPPSGEQEAQWTDVVTIDEVLVVLATGGVRDASDILRAHRRARAHRTAARAAQGLVITFAEASASAPTPEARKAVLARGRCEAQFREVEGGPVGLTCVLVRGHAQLNKGEPHAALRSVGSDPECEESWVRW